MTAGARAVLIAVLVTGVVTSELHAQANATALVDAAFQAAKAGRWQDAIDQFQQSIHADLEGLMAKDARTVPTSPRTLLGLATAYAAVGRDAASAQAYLALMQIAPRAAGDSVVRQGLADACATLNTKAGLLFSQAIDLAAQTGGEQNVLAHVMATGDVHWGRELARQFKLDLWKGLAEGGQALTDVSPHMAAALLRLAEAEISREADVDVSEHRNYLVPAVPVPQPKSLICPDRLGTIRPCLLDGTPFHPPDFTPAYAAKLRLQDRGLRAVYLAVVWAGIDSREAERLYQDGMRLIRQADMRLVFSVALDLAGHPVRVQKFAAGDNAASATPVGIEFWNEGKISFTANNRYQLRGDGRMRTDVDWYYAVANKQLVTLSEGGPYGYNDAAVDDRSEMPAAWPFLHEASDGRDALIEGLASKGELLLRLAKGFTSMSSADAVYRGPR